MNGDQLVEHLALEAWAQRGRSALGARAPLVTSDAALATCGLCRYALRWRHALTRPLRLPEPRVRSVRKGDAA